MNDQVQGTGRFARGADEEPKPKLLYVDDDASNRDLVYLRLRSRYEVLLASDCKSACEVLRQFSQAEDTKKLSALLLDIQLQGSDLDGVHLARLVRGRLPAERVPPYARDLVPLQLPIIFVTAFGSIYTPAQLEDAGGDAMIRKPVDFVKLCGALTRLTLRGLT